MSDFEVKDSGARQEFGGGMVRDTEDGKVDYTLVLDGPMFRRWAEHLTKGAVKYEARNWMKAADGTPAERQVVIDRAKRSAIRHLVQYLAGQRDEDHAAAVMFNLNVAEYLADQPESSIPVVRDTPGGLSGHEDWQRHPGSMVTGERRPGHPHRHPHGNMDVPLEYLNGEA